MSVHRAIARATENRGPYNFRIRFICTTMRYSSQAGQYGFVIERVPPLSRCARAIRKFTTVEPTQRGMLVVGFSGGVLGARQVPRYVVGSVNLTEFSITFATSATFIVTLELANLEPLIPLVFGGLVSAPFAG